MNGGGQFTRYSMAGWMFLVVLLASIALSPNQAPWKMLLGWLSGGPSTSQAVGSIAAAAFGIIAGATAPPALGYVLARTAAAIIEAFEWQWSVLLRVAEPL